jgi:hypothetical protein
MVRAEKMLERGGLETIRWRQLGRGIARQHVRENCREDDQHDQEQAERAQGFPNDASKRAFETVDARLPRPLNQNLL